LLSFEKLLVAASIVAKLNCNDSTVLVIPLAAAQQNSKCKQPHVELRNIGMHIKRHRLFFTTTFLYGIVLLSCSPEEAVAHNE